MDLCRDWLGPDSMVELHVLAPGQAVELATSRRHLSRSGRCRPSTATGTATSWPRRRCSTPSPDRTGTGCCTPPTPARWPAPTTRPARRAVRRGARRRDVRRQARPRHRPPRPRHAARGPAVAARLRGGHGRDRRRGDAPEPPQPAGAGAARAARRARRRARRRPRRHRHRQARRRAGPAPPRAPAAHARASRPWPSASPATGVAVTYVATSGQRPDDAEWQHRIALHRARRPAHWSTVETTDVAGVLAAAPAGSVVLVDCLALWLTAQLDELDAWQRCEAGLADQVRAEAAARTTALVDALEGSAADVVLVTNEVGMGVVPGHRVGPALPRPPRHPQRPGGGRLPGDDAGRGRDPRAPRPDERDARTHAR